jgi:hypothetical protein
VILSPALTEAVSCWGPAWLLLLQEMLEAVALRMGSYEPARSKGGEGLTRWSVVSRLTVGTLNGSLTAAVVR